MIIGRQGRHLLRDIVLFVVIVARRHREDIALLLIFEGKAISDYPQAPACREDRLTIMD